jgi:hypothetical protein
MTSRRGWWRRRWRRRILFERAGKKEKRRKRKNKNYSLADRFSACAFPLIVAPSTPRVRDER